MDRDRWGALLIADTGNQRIRKVDAGGVITTVAGSGPTGLYEGDYGGDGGPALDARLDGPTAVAADAMGNIYVADRYNHCVRKVGADGIITTAAGTPDVPNYGGDGGPATDAFMDNPTDVAVDAEGSLYLTDMVNMVVRKVDPAGIVTTLAGNGDCASSKFGVPPTEFPFCWPSGIALGDSGEFHVSELNRSFVAKVLDRVLADTVSDDGTVQETKAYVEPWDQYHLVWRGRHTYTKDKDTHMSVLRFGYDSLGRLLSVSDPRFGGSRMTTVVRDADGIPEQIVSPDGIVTALAIDPITNRLVGVTQPDGGTYAFEYDGNGLMTAESDPEGNRFDHGFDDLGRVTDVWDPEGGHWNYDVTEFADGRVETTKTTAEGNATTYTDHTGSSGDYASEILSPSGGTTGFDRSADGMSVTKTLPCGTDLSFEYGLNPNFRFRYLRRMTQGTPSGLERVTERLRTYEDRDGDHVTDKAVETVTVDGRVTVHETDDLAHTRTLTSPENRQVVTNHDEDTGLTTRVRIAGLHDTVYDHHDDGRLRSVTVGDRVTGFVHDMAGDPRSVTVTDPGNRTIVYEYDDMMRLRTVRRPDTSVVSFEHDRNGNMTVLFPPSEARHGFGHNGVNLNDAYETPLENTYSHVYDRDRRLRERHFPSGKTITYVYDPAKLGRIETPEGNVVFGYDDCGAKVVSVTKGDEAIGYGHDGGIVTSETLTGTLNQSLVYHYDRNGDLEIDGMTYAGARTDYAWDDDGLLTGSGRLTITRNAGNGLPESVTAGDLSLTRSFNGHGETDGETFQVGSGNVLSWGVDERHPDGRIRQKTEDSSAHVYEYDEMGRLLTVTRDGALIEEYRYDDFGRRDHEMSVPRGIAGRSLTYDDEDRLVTVGGVVYEHDDDGFLERKTDGTEVTEYDYSSRGELLTVTLPDSTLIEYVHDPLGRRIAKKVNGAVVEKYLWQGLTRLLAVYNADDSLRMRFEYADARMPVAMAKDGATYYLAYDQVGSLKVVADASGNVAKRIGCDTFGNILSDSDPAFAVPFGFAGGLHDRDTGLVRFGHRDYDPETGRWTAKDPILFAAGNADLYGYCANDPINWIDSLGLSEADVLKLHDIFQFMVGALTEAERRHPYSYLNNFLSTLQMLNKCGMSDDGNRYLGCGEQAEAVRTGMSQCKKEDHFDDNWTFELVQGHTGSGFPHKWLVLKSDNPDDPTIVADPWADHFGDPIGSYSSE